MVSLMLVYDILRWEEKDIIAKARERGLGLRLLHINSKPLHVGRNGFSPDMVALQRCVSFNKAMASTLVLESGGLRVVNNSHALMVSEDKLWTQSLLIRNGITTPRTIISFEPHTTVDAAKELGFPVVIKPLKGSWGRLVSLGRDEEEVRSIAEHRTYLGDHYKIAYVQEYVRKPGRDIRSFCLGDTVPAAIYRVSPHWITNTARGGKAEPAPITPELEEITLRACRAVGVEFGGVDIVEDPERGYMVLEVNGVPEYKNTIRVTGVDLSSLLLDYLVSLYKR